MYSKVHVVGFVRYMWWDVWGPCDGICEVHVVGCVRYMWWDVWGTCGEMCEVHVCLLFSFLMMSF